MANPLAYIPVVGFIPLYFSNYTRSDLITNPLFTSFNDERMTSTNNLNVVDYALRAKMLSDAIPAESFAAGRNATTGVAGNYDMNGLIEERWPSNREGWFHSDLRNVSFWFTHRLFEKIKKGQ